MPIKIEGFFENNLRPTALDPAPGGEEEHLLAVAALHVQEERREQACKYF